MQSPNFVYLYADVMRRDVEWREDSFEVVDDLLLIMINV
jgi:hypothetical protein